MYIAGEAPAIPDLTAAIPPWAETVGVIGLLTLMVVAFLRGWVMTRAACDREVEAERRIGEIWKANHDQAAQLNEQLTGAFQPVLEGQSAILKVVESMQARQLEAERREETRSWLRDRRDPQG